MTDENYSGLTQLGHHVEQPASPDTAKLERVANPSRGRNYVVRFTCPEFTALCPITGQPDFAQGKGSPGRAQLYVDGHLVGQAEFPVTTPIAFNLGGLTCGANPGTPVTPAYRAPFRFTGTLHTVTVDLSGDLIIDSEGEMRMAMARQ